MTINNTRSADERLLSLSERYTSGQISRLDFLARTAVLASVGASIPAWIGARTADPEAAAAQATQGAADGPPLDIAEWSYFFVAGNGRNRFARSRSARRIAGRVLRQRRSPWRYRSWCSTRCVEQPDEAPFPRAPRRVPAPDGAQVVDAALRLHQRPPCLALAAHPPEGPIPDTWCGVNAGRCCSTRSAPRSS